MFLDRNKVSNRLRMTAVFLASILFIIWPLKHTIAARNTLLFLTVTLSIIWLVINRPKISYRYFVPAMLLLGVPLWLLAVYYIWPIDLYNQGRELSSTWLRSVVALISGVSIGLMIARGNSILDASILFLGIIFYAVFHTIYFLIIPVSIDTTYIGFFKSKISATYFILPAFSASFGIFYSRWVKKGIRSDKKLYGIIKIFLFFVMVVTIFNLIIFNSLNGLIVLTFVSIPAVVLAIVANRSEIVSGYVKNPINLIFLVIAIVFILFGLKNYDEKNSNKFSHLIGDIKVAISTEQSQDWRRDYPAEQNPPTPKDVNGREINGSTYERISWFVDGSKILLEHPMGLGYVNYAYGHYMRSRFPGSRVTKTHSGWLDFALGSGLLGIALIWGAIFLTLHRAYRACSQNNLNGSVSAAGFWVLWSLFLLWFIGELCEREYIEHLYFLIGLISMVGVQNQNQN